MTDRPPISDDCPDFCSLWPGCGHTVADFDGSLTLRGRGRGQDTPDQPSTTSGDRATASAGAQPITATVRPAMLVPPILDPILPRPGSVSERFAEAIDDHFPSGQRARETAAHVHRRPAVRAHGAAPDARHHARRLRPANRTRRGIDVTDETTPDVPQMIDPDTADEGLRAAAATAQAAETDPIAMAAMNAELRNSVRGAHAIIHALVEQLAGVGNTVTIPREKWRAPDPAQELVIKTKPDQSVEVTVKRRINLAIRPRRK